MSSTSNSVSKAKKLLRNANAVCFDVDSTVIQSEGIDDLAHYLGKNLSLSLSLSLSSLIQVHTTTKNNNMRIWHLWKSLLSLSLSLSLSSLIQVHTTTTTNNNMRIWHLWKSLLSLSLSLSLIIDTSSHYYYNKQRYEWIFEIFWKSLLSLSLSLLSCWIDFTFLRFFSQNSLSLSLSL